MSPLTTVTIVTYHPGSEEVPTPRPCGGHLHEERVSEAHEWWDPIVLCTVAPGEEEEVVDERKDEEDDEDDEEHRHPGPHVILKHPQAEQAICTQKTMQILRGSLD